MIRFVCTCGNPLEVPEELAGDSLQCPECGLLTDVPNLSDIASFTEDGTYRMDADRPVTDDPERFAELGIIYSKDKHDAEGNEIDLRTLPAGRKLGDEPDEGVLDFKDDKPEIGDRPKYDPETGELIRPIEVQNQPERDRDPSTIPMATAALNYASGEFARRLNPLKIAVELFMPLNLVVMFFVICTHIFNSMFFVAAAGLFFLWPPLLMAQALILSHYGNVIDDIGRNEQDDLPRPLRDLSFSDDIWGPFVAMFGGIMIAMAIPTLLIAAVFQKLGVPILYAWIIGGIFGTFLAPAILLTTNTSGSTYNLRPDRVFQVMKITGGHYILVCFLWGITWPIYALGWLGLCLTLLKWFVGPAWTVTGIMFEWLLVMPALLCGIYLMHYFCWYLGLLYRAHHDDFPWVLQRHIRDPDADRKRVTHADKIGKRRRPSTGHLPMVTPPPPPPPVPPATTR